MELISLTSRFKARGVPVNLPWKITLLGQLRAEQPGQRAITRFSTQKTAALLAYLAYHPQEASPREVLIEMLWPDAEPGAGRHRLSMALSSLRRQLEPPGIPTGAVLVADRFFVRLNDAVFTTDVARFEEALLSAAEARSSAELEQRLTDAAWLVGGPLLPGHYEDWVVAERERLSERCFHTICQLRALLDEAGEYARALDWARRAVKLDPLREEAHYELMRLLAAAGQPAAALRQYRKLKRVLAEAFGEAPSAACRELASRINVSGADVTLSTHQTILAAPSLAASTPQRHASAPQVPPPAGTVTFLLADSEGAAFRPQMTDGADAAATLWERHRTLLCREFAACKGHLVRERRGFLVAAFAAGRDALRCAIACRDALPRPVSGPDGAARASPPQVRMALHTADAEPMGESYPEAVLSHGVRLLVAAHGGQILVSTATAALLQPAGAAAAEPGGVRLADLGVYRLRAAGTPERVFQVEYPDPIGRQFPPVRAEAAHADSLPLRLTRFFGRGEEQQQLDQALLSGEARLVTLTGAGGVGKTRLALEVAERLRSRAFGAVWFVTLADLSDPSRITDALLRTLCLTRSPSAEPLDQIAAALWSQGRSLLVLDNFEHLVEGGAPLIGALLQRAPSLRCLVTSRQPLALAGEREFLVHPLAVPRGEEAPEELALCPSVRLFVDRAQAVRPDFQVTPGHAPALAALVRQLEGIPLALELAAAHAHVLSPAQMLGQLARGFEFLVSRKRDVPERHRTLWAAIDWSYQLLPADLRRFFTRLSAFRGGWTLEAAEAVCQERQALDYLTQLRECSLLTAQEPGAGHEEPGAVAGGGEMRFRMLETVRQYSRQRLVSSSEHTPISSQHTAFFLQMAEEAEPHLIRDNQAIWLERLEREHDNLRAALDWCQGNETGVTLGVRLVGALWRFWSIRGYLGEGRERLTLALGRAGDDAPQALRAKALNGAGNLAENQGDYAAARAFYQESLSLRRHLNDPSGIAIALNNLGFVARAQGEYARAHRLFEQSLMIWRTLGNTWGIAYLLNNTGLVAYGQGDAASARRLFCESLTLRRELGDKWGIASSLYNLGLAANAKGETASAYPFFEESMALWREVGDRAGIAYCLEGLAQTCEAEGKPRRAVWLLGAARALRDAMGVPLPPSERAVYDATIAALRAALGDAAFTAEWSAGRMLDWEQALAYALAGIPAPRSSPA